MNRRSSTRSHPWHCIPAPVVLALAATLAHAGDPTVAFAPIWVGSDPGCDYATIQAAIDASQSAGMMPTAIHVAATDPPAAYTAQEIRIVGRNLVLWGGWQQCRQTTPWIPDMVLISGAGGAAAAVIEVRDQAVVHLRGLDIQAGDPAESSGSGGGVDWDASGALTIDATIIRNNAGVRGGGLRFHHQDAGSTAELVLKSNTRIEVNRALEGGGLHLSGYSRLSMVEANVFFHRNAATRGSGGGIQVIAPAKASIGSPDLSGGSVGVFRDNVAREEGGGIHVVNQFGVPGSAEVSLYSVDPMFPLSFVQNAAWAGGAMAVNSLSAGASVLCALGLHVRGNDGFQAAAVSVTGPEASWTSSPAGACESTLPNDVPPCPAVGSSLCNVYADNVGALAIFKSIGFATLKAERLRVSGSRAIAGAVFDIGQANSPEFVGLEIARSLIDAGDTATIVNAFTGTATLRHVTIAGNAERPGSTVLHANAAAGRIELENAIVSQDMPLGNFNSGGRIRVERTLARNFQSVIQPAPPNGNVIGSATFSDTAYRLAASSLGLDHVDGDAGVDLDGHPAAVDLPSVPNAEGVSDLGAYERQIPETPIHRDGFEPPVGPTQAPVSADRT
jgi:hypothetical protein